MHWSTCEKYPLICGSMCRASLARQSVHAKIEVSLRTDVSAVLYLATWRRPPCRGALDRVEALPSCHEQYLCDGAAKQAPRQSAQNYSCLQSNYSTKILSGSTPVKAFAFIQRFGHLLVAQSDQLACSYQPHPSLCVSEVRLENAFLCRVIARLATLE